MIRSVVTPSPVVPDPRHPGVDAARVTLDGGALLPVLVDAGLPAH